MLIALTSIPLTNATEVYNTHFDMFERLFQEPASTFDYKWFRAVGPGASSAFHFDGIYMK